MLNRYFGSLLATGTLLLLATTWVEAQAQPQKDGQPILAPKGFDKARTGIEHGKMETIEYDSKTVGAKRKMVVYTPPGYAKDTKYPVFYLLHGLNGNETNWSKGGAAGNILDNLYADKKLTPMIVVMPNGMVQIAGQPGGGKGKGGDQIGNFEKELINDVMPTAEGRFPIIKDAAHRALGGLSMGGGQSLLIGTKHLDKFAYIGGFSSAYLQNKANFITNPNEVNKLKVLYVGCGDSPKETLYNSNKAFHAALEKSKVKHVWNVYPEGEHNMTVWKNDLYVFSQMLFKDQK